MITGDDITASVMVMASGGGGGLVQSPPDMMHHHNIMDTSSHVEMMPSEYHFYLILVSKCGPGDLLFVFSCSNRFTKQNIFLIAD